jgi:ubiquinone/menaquinone biosynthesis C-methylase UbiE
MVQKPDADILRHYERVAEAERLSRGAGQLELVRTQELLTRYLPPPPAAVLDVGGGPGVYACWLAQRGYEVHLIDIVPRHVDQALAASRERPDGHLASAALGDARKLERSDASLDSVLLLGPLYHLTERADRVQALREACRVVRRDGVVLAAAISRFASLLDGLVRGYLDDPEFARIAERDLRDGQHRNVTNNPVYFTTAFFHRPDELKAEVEEAGLRHEATLAVEGPAWLLQNFDAHWNDLARRERLLEALRALEKEPAVLGASAHLLAMARKTGP